jgi:hypothetical protein
VSDILRVENADIVREVSAVLAGHDTRTPTPYHMQEQVKALKRWIQFFSLKVKRLSRFLQRLVDDEAALALMNLGALKIDPSLYK